MSSQPYDSKACVKTSTDRPSLARARIVAARPTSLAHRPVPVNSLYQRCGYLLKRLAFNRTVVLRYRIHLEQRHYAPATNQPEAGGRPTRGL